MKAVVEGSAACDQYAGIGRYSRNILSRLFARGAEDQWTVLRAPAERGAPSKFGFHFDDRIRMKTLPFSRRNADRLWFRLRAPVDLRAFGVRGDVVYSPDYTAPPMVGVPRMITIHDLAYLTHPQRTTEALRVYLESVVPRQIDAADLIAVVSYATKADVMQHYRVSEDRIVVARNAVDERFYRARPLGEFERNRLRIPEQYLLMVGTIEPRKNHINALRALEQSGVGRDFPLVIAGRPGWGFEEAMSLAESLHERGNVKLPMYVPDDDLPSLIAGARALVYPSWTEGFGLPVAEALAAGTTVITGNAPALREVGGDHVHYVDPADVDDIAAKLRMVVESDPTAAERAARQEWTRQFSWDSSTSIVYENLKKLTTR